jgi:hypothetical protein
MTTSALPPLRVEDWRAEAVRRLELTYRTIRSRHAR